MQGIGSGCVKAGVMLCLLTSCSSLKAAPATIAEPPLFQKWELQPGDTVAGYTVTGGLGDISIALNGKTIYAPAVGDSYIDKRGCVYFSSADTPAYLFRLCGLKSPKLGHLQAGEAIATGETLRFAALLRQSDGKWALVEPDKSLLERTLKQR